MCQANQLHWLNNEICGVILWALLAEPNLAGSRWFVFPLQVQLCQVTPRMVSLKPNEHKASLRAGCGFDILYATVNQWHIRSTCWGSMKAIKIPALLNCFMEFTFVSRSYVKLVTADKTYRRIKEFTSSKSDERDKAKKRRARRQMRWEACFLNRHLLYSADVHVCVHKC